MVAEAVRITITIIIRIARGIGLLITILIATEALILGVILVQIRVVVVVAEAAVAVVAAAVADALVAQDKPFRHCRKPLSIYLTGAFFVIYFASIKAFYIFAPKLKKASLPKGEKPKMVVISISFTLLLFV